MHLLGLEEQVHERQREQVFDFRERPIVSYRHGDLVNPDAPPLWRRCGQYSQATGLSQPRSARLVYEGRRASGSQVAAALNPGRGFVNE
jgi:hypothetical protein